MFDYSEITETPDITVGYYFTFSHDHDLLSVDRVAPDMQKYLQDQPYHHTGDEDFVNQIDNIDEWRPFHARLIM